MICASYSVSAVCDYTTEVDENGAFGDVVAFGFDLVTEVVEALGCVVAVIVIHERMQPVL